LTQTHTLPYNLQKEAARRFTQEFTAAQEKRSVEAAIYTVVLSEI